MPFIPRCRDSLTSASQYTINGVHLNQNGYAEFAKVMYRGLFQETPPPIDESIRLLTVDKNLQYLRRYRPVNTFYYTGGRERIMDTLIFYLRCKASTSWLVTVNEQYGRKRRGIPSM